MNDNAAELSKARNEIVKIQKEMTERFVKLAATIEKLDDLMPLAETREFLIARCGVPANDIATYSKFSKRMKGFGEMLIQRRVPLTVGTAAGCRQDPRSTRRGIPKIEEDLEILIARDAVESRMNGSKAIRIIDVDGRWRRRAAFHSPC